MTKNHRTPGFGPAINRFTDVLAHHDKFAFKGVSRLAREARVSPASVSRLINGKMNPSFLMVARLTEALERHLGFRIDPRDLIAENGRFLEPFVCELMSCAGCLPEIATDEFGDIKPTYQDVKPGQWASSRHPKGFRTDEKGDIHD
jgi:transcriptional regulator with XRE-family HTH domain